MKNYMLTACTKAVMVYLHRYGTQRYVPLCVLVLVLRSLQHEQMLHAPGALEPLRGWVASAPLALGPEASAAKP